MVILFWREILALLGRHPRPSVAVREGKWRARRESPGGRLELFDLERDVSGEYSDVVAALWEYRGEPFRCCQSDARVRCSERSCETLGSGKETGPGNRSASGRSNRYCKEGTYACGFHLWHWG